MRARGIGLAHVGRKRESNQDCWLADDQLGLYAVADGMGGYRGGELAAATALNAVATTVRAERELLDEVRAGQAKPKKLGLLVEGACQAASRAVFERAGREADKNRMGCTLTVVLVANGWGVMGHVGDSRLYVCRKGAVHQLSEDHSYAAELARAGVIPAGEVRKHRYAHVLTRSVGTRPAVNADVLRFSLLPEDRLLLCSDGLSNYLADSTWLAKELAEEDLDGIPAELVRFANEAGGADNITALVVGVEAEPEGPLLAAAELAQAQLTALEGCFLFSGLSLARKAWVLSHCVLREHAPGLLVSEGAALPGLVLVVRGAAQVERDGAIVGALGPGQQFGASALLAPRAARANVSMAESSRTLLMSPESLRTLARSRPRLGVLLLRRLARELGRALDERVARESNPSPELAP